MGSFLHKIWDETLAGPAPDTGLGKLRKYDSFSATRSPPMVADREVEISRSITILKTNSTFRNLSVDPGSAPESPAGPTTPRTPLTPETPGVDVINKFTRRKSSIGALEQPETRSPTAYDWIVISALDRWERKWRFVPCLSCNIFVHRLYLMHLHINITPYKSSNKNKMVRTNNIYI